MVCQQHISFIFTLISLEKNHESICYRTSASTNGVVFCHWMIPGLEKNFSKLQTLVKTTRNNNKYLFKKSLDDFMNNKEKGGELGSPMF